MRFCCGRVAQFSNLLPQKASHHSVPSRVLSNKTLPAPYLQSQISQHISEAKQVGERGRKREKWNVAYNLWAIAQSVELPCFTIIVKGRAAFLVSASYGQQHRRCEVALGYVFEGTPFKEIHSNPLSPPLTMSSDVGQESKNTVTISKTVYVKPSCCVSKIYWVTYVNYFSVKIMNTKKMLPFVGEGRD